MSTHTYRLRRGYSATLDPSGPPHSPPDDETDTFAQEGQPVPILSTCGNDAFVHVFTHRIPPSVAQKPMSSVKTCDRFE